jgi:hypothetical protein
MRTLSLVVLLVAMTVAALWWAADAWMSIEGPPMPAAGWAALVGGVVVSLLVGCGLMALLFYSHRHGYDDIDDRSGRPK